MATRGLAPSVFLFPEAPISVQFVFAQVYTTIAAVPPCSGDVTELAFGCICQTAVRACVRFYLWFYLCPCCTVAGLLRFCMAMGTL